MRSQVTEEVIFDADEVGFRTVGGEPELRDGAWYLKGRGVRGVGEFGSSVVRGFSIRMVRQPVAAAAPPASAPAPIAAAAARAPRAARGAVS